MKTFAAIDVGSYAMEMKIYEISPKIGIREIDCVRHQLDLGTDSYGKGKIGHEKVDELCRVLSEFAQIMTAYKVDDYKAYGTSALREIGNQIVLLDQIAQRTGIKIELISNSEQRFLDYKAVACHQEQFEKLMEKGTVIADLGGGSIQLSLYENGSLITTQNLKLGVLRIQEQMSHINSNPKEYENLIDEMVAAQLSVFKKLYLKDCNISNMIVVDDYISSVIDRTNVANEQRIIDYKSNDSLLAIMQNKTQTEISRLLDIPAENVQLTFISVVLLNRICKIMNIEKIWVPGAVLCDGIVYEYGETHKLISQAHDFDQDIISCTRSISKRYMGSKKRSETLQGIALNIFDSIKKVHGLGKRERLLLQISTLLHDCGKYISLVNLGECSYNIIMSTEIIGLSHREREIVANVVKYNHLEFESYEVLNDATYIDRTAYLVIAKLTAILKLANGLDRSHKQKFKDVTIVLKDDLLQFTVDQSVDITLEKGLFGNRADFFEEVFSVKPVIKQRRKA